MPNWFGVKNNAGKVVSYISDDVANFQNIPVGFSTTGPFPSQAAAQAALEPVAADPRQVIIAGLQAKASAAWTLADVADWLKNR